MSGPPEYGTYKLASPRRAFFLLAFVARKMTPRSRTSGYGLLLACRSSLDAGLFSKKKKLTMFENILGQKPGKSSPSVLVRHRNRSGVVDLVGREPLMFARVENGVTKFSPKRQKTPPKFWSIKQKQQFSVGNFHFFGRGKTNFWGGV